MQKAVLLFGLCYSLFALVSSRAQSAVAQNAVAQSAVAQNAVAQSAVAQRAVAQNAKVEVLGVSVGKKLTQSQKEVFMFASEGTRLQIGIALPGRTIIGEARDACKLGKFSDDKGTELFAPLGRAPEADDWMGTFGPKYSEDGKQCGLQVEAPGLPSHGATKLQFSGTLVLRCGSVPKTVEQKNIALKKGTKITIGPVPFEVVKVQVEGNETKLDLRATKTLERIIKIAFYDAAGREIKSRREGYTSGGFFGNYIITQYFVLSGKPTKLNAKISYFEKVENVTVPLNAEVGLGF